MPRALASLAVVLLLAATPAATRVARAAGGVPLESRAARAQVRRARFRLAVRALDGGRLFAEEPADGGLFFERGGIRHGLGRVRRVTRTRDGVVLAVDAGESEPTTVTLRWRTARALEITLEPPQPESIEALGGAFRAVRDEAIYGLTERLRDSPEIAPGLIDIPAEDFAPPEAGSLNRRGETVNMRVLPTVALYAPFYQSSRGYGLYVESTTHGVFDVAKTDGARVAFRFPTGLAPESRRLRLHVFVGPRHATILDEYTALTGRPVVPPAWALRHWRWRDQLDIGTATLDGTAVNADLADDVAQYDALGFPSGVYLFDRPWAPSETDTFSFSRFAWDPVRLPNAPAMLASLRARGWRVVVWSAAWACGTGPDDNGTAALAQGFLAPPRGTTGVPTCGDTTGGRFVLDVTNPAARAWFAARLAAFAAAEGIDGIKLDRGEEHIPDLPSDVWADGRSGAEVRNAYPVLQLAMHHDAMTAARGSDFVITARAGFAGSQQYGVVWGGDSMGTSLGLRAAIIGQLRAAFLGFPVWGSDTGGYYEFTEREVFARWLEVSAFSGIMEIGGHGTHAPWNMPTPPAFDPELVGIYGRYTRVREVLHDYLVRTADAVATGMPMARPLVFAFPDDRRVLDLWDEWLLGDDLLVAPVWRAGDRTRDVYLPRGRWRSWWEPSVVVRGPRTVTVDVPLDRIPVYVRDDAVLPSPPA